MKSAYLKLDADLTKVLPLHSDFLSRLCDPDPD